MRYHFVGNLILNIFLSKRFSRVRVRVRVRVTVRVRVMDERDVRVRVRVRVRVIGIITIMNHLL